MVTKILFILKHREIPTGNGGGYSHSGFSSGLFNSASMIKEMLDLHGIGNKTIDARVVQVIDNNGIDKEVNLFRPDIVIIEAFWVVPEKFEVLTRLYPKIKWIIRGHSNIPFLASEGNAVSWASKYINYHNVFLATNTPSSLADLKDIILERYSDHQDKRLEKKILYFPNFYVAYDITEEETSDVFNPGLVERVLHFLNFHVPKIHSHSRDNTVHIGCFGAVRLLKNHLIQAVAALRYAKKHGKHLYFHINSTRIEGGGDPVIKNLRALFDAAHHATLIEHPWMPHDEFIKIIDKMHVAMQVSFSETFNIVTADAVTMGVPVVVSKEIGWVGSKYQADPTNANDIVAKLEEALRDAECGEHNLINQAGLNAYNKRSHAAISNTLLSVLEISDHHHHHPKLH